MKIKEGLGSRFDEDSMGWSCNGGLLRIREVVVVLNDEKTWRDFEVVQTSGWADDDFVSPLLHIIP